MKQRHKFTWINKPQFVERFCCDKIYSSWGLWSIWSVSASPCKLRGNNYIGAIWYGICSQSQIKATNIWNIYFDLETFLGSISIIWKSKIQIITKWRQSAPQLKHCYSCFWLYIYLQMKVESWIFAIAIITSISFFGCKHKKFRLNCYRIGFESRVLSSFFPVLFGLGQHQTLIETAGSRVQFVFNVKVKSREFTKSYCNFEFSWKNV